MYELMKKYEDFISELKPENMDNLEVKIETDYQAGKIMPQSYDRLMKSLYSKKYGCEAHYQDTKKLEETTRSIANRGFHIITYKDYVDARGEWKRIIYCD